MIDPTLCQPLSPPGLWTKVSLNWTVLYGLSQPAVVVSLLLLLAIWPWILHLNGCKKPAVTFSSGLLVVYLTLLSPLFISFGNRLLVDSVPPDKGGKAGAIVVLGRGPLQNPSRAAEAQALWQRQRAPLIFASGRIDAPLIADLLRSKVPAEAVSGEPCSRTTDENAEFTAAILRPQGIRTIILVTDPPHMRRSLLTFESFGFKVIPHTSPLDPKTDRTYRRFLLFRESVGLVSYGLMGRYAAREVPPASVIYADTRSEAGLRDVL